MSLTEIKRRDTQYLFQNYGRLDLCFERGEREFLYDIDGNEYLDLVAGIAVNVLGHAHPAVVNAIIDQATRLMHVSNLYQIQEQVDLGEAINGITPDPLGVSLFVNSGAEANEAAFKLAVKHTGRGRIVTANGSFHGRTSVALAATGQKNYHRGFEPLLTDAFTMVPYGDVEALKASVDGSTAAVMLEAIQGEGGIIPCNPEFFRTARDLCDEYGALMMVDEVQTGIGRTGRMFGFEHFGVIPDVITLAKALGGGFPIGAIVSTPEVAATFTPGSHGSTFGGNPLACAVAKAVLDTVSEQGLVEHSTELGESWMSRLRNITSDNDAVREVRGRGLMIGVDMAGAREFQDFAMGRGVLVNVCGGSTVRLVPPLIVSESSTHRLDALLTEFLGGTRAGKEI